ncbi:terminase large subunit [Acetobacter senegalensis]|uniref:terminase large subunit n=1 Tax=Acetobacter senegalensis TaxID=446692 RepID=UPI00264D7D70|nr:terminase large subunit [Acetobacter senegalensis]MDN7354336.1 terminase large subunit [Acetobacter senegalensis]
MLNMGRPDWRERIRAGQSLLPEIEPVNPTHAATAVGYFDDLRLPDVGGNPFLKDAAGPWFREIVAMLHGSLDPMTGKRLIRELFLLVPKKNSKTTYGAALMLVSVILSTRPRAEFLIVAPTKEVASLSFEQAAGMVLLDPELRKRFKLQESLKRLTYLPTGAKLNIKAFDANVVTGVKPAGVLVDEEHVIAKNSAADSVMIQLRGGMISQPEAFLAVITTQSDAPPRGVFKADLRQARAIRDGASFYTEENGEQVPVANDVLPVLYEFPEDIQKPATVLGEMAPWENPAIWPMVLPNLGRPITIEQLKGDFDKSKGKGVEELAKWASQHLNIEIGIALRDDRWAGADFWQSQAREHLTLDAIIERSEVIVAGIDGGGLDDLLSLTILGREAGTDLWMHWQKSWVTRKGIERRKREASLMEDFVGDGDLVIVDEVGPDILDLAETVADVDQSGKLYGVGLDPWSVADIVAALDERGIREDRVHGVGQGWKLTGAIKTAERKLAGRALIHCGQPIMAWAVGNARVEAKGNAVVIEKQAAGWSKIDPLMSLLDAVVLMSLNPQPPRPKGTMDGFLRRGLLVA